MSPPRSGHSAFWGFPLMGLRQKIAFTPGSSPTPCRQAHHQFQSVVSFYWQRSRLGTCLIYFSSVSRGPNSVRQEPAGPENQTTAYRQVVNFMGLLLSTPGMIWKNTTPLFSWSHSTVAQNPQQVARWSLYHLHSWWEEYTFPQPPSLH